MSDEVAKTSSVYDAMAGGWALPRALMGGTTAMRESGQTYLPQEPAESDAAFSNRISRSVLFNAFRRTIRGTTGKVFSKGIAISEDTPESVKNWLDNADMAGQNLTSFAATVFSDGAQVGLSHIFVDMPAGPAARTRKEEVDIGRRPYFVHIRAEDLIGWKSETINSKEVLSQIRFRERVTVEDGKYGVRISERIRVVWPDRFEVWEKQQNKNHTDHEWELLNEGELSLGKIPLVTFYAHRTGFMTATPPLEDLAHLNVAHWQSASDQRHILHVARVPLLFGRNLKVLDDDGKQIEYGPNRMIVSDDPQGDLKFVEHGGAAISAGRQDLVDIEDRMRVMGLELFMPKTGNQTATGKAIDSAEQNSAVKMMALSLQNTLNNALGLMADWMKIPDGGEVEVNTDYGVSIGDTQEVAVLLNSRMAGEISQATFWSELKRRGVLFEGFDPDVETELLKDETPALGNM